MNPRVEYRGAVMKKVRTLKVVYIRSSKYDDDGYVLRFWRGVLPSNTLMCLRSITRQAAADNAFGPGVAVTVECYDDTVERIPIRRLIRENCRPGTQVVIGLAGVQTNQFARASDLAIEFRRGGVPVMIGGFHVSGMLGMFGESVPELQRLLNAGVTLVKGEVEGPGVLTAILQDALSGMLRPIYDIAEPPCLLEAPVPLPERKDLRRFFMGNMATFDTSRGCPFDCSFCTVINVQGRTMRYRSAACVLKAVEASHAQGINCFFFTDDNLARNPVWEELFDGLAALRNRGLDVSFMMQIDTRAHRIKRFVEKAARAGCYRVFVGMESLNEKNLEAASKHQNDADDYAAMVEAWHAVDVLVYVGYIIGFPHDSAESVQRDIEHLTNHVKVDKAAFFMLTPLPGSRDHHEMVVQQMPIDADTNNYDSVHETFRHANFAPGEWAATYREAWETFYAPDNMVNVLLRTPKRHYWPMFWTFVYFRYCALTRAHPMLTGLFPIKGWKRRPSYPREPMARLAWKRACDLVAGLRAYGRLFFEFQEIWMLTRKPADPRWATLAELREKWCEVRRQLRECDLRERRGVAVEEIRAMLRSASAKLQKLSDLPSSISHPVRRRLRRQAREIDSYLRGLEVPKPSWQQVVKAEEYVSKRLLSGYEELAIRYVAKRRRFNEYREELLRRVKSGRIMTMNVGRIPLAIAFELTLGMRFVCTAFFQTAGKRILDPFL